MNQYHNNTQCDTSDLTYSCWSLLPAPEPCTIDPPPDYFYDHVAKHLVRDTVRIMNNGLPIDLTRVQALEAEIDKTLTEVMDTLEANPYVAMYQKEKHKTLTDNYVQDRLSKCKLPAHFLPAFNAKKIEHRSYFMHIYAQEQNLTEPTELLPTGVPKWTANLVKRFATTRPVLQRLLDASLSNDHPTVQAAMDLFAKHKAELYNRSYLEQARSPEVPYPEFNPNSSTQLRELFALIGLTSEAKSKTSGEESWDRKQIERVNSETDDPDVKSLTQALIDFSYGNIIKVNFIPAFYRYTVDGKLHGTYKLFGAKSFRYTSQAPNMLNAPSTGSRYAKPVKRCFTAPPGYLVYAIDLSALEDRVMASLSRDKNKCSVFTDGLDGHCLNAYGYFPNEVAQYMPITGDTITDVKEFYRLCEEGHKELKDIRQRGKPVTFGLNYGAFPPKVASTLKIPISEAQALFDNYHNVLYSGITSYRENYVLPTAQTNGKLHLGLGCYINSDNPDRDIRTLTNATCQFWSVVTALTINKMHQLIDINNMSNDIICTSTIYDSIYFIVREDPQIIKWLNDNIVPLMTRDFMQDQTIHNEAAGELGLDWASLHHLANEASIQDIEELIHAIHNPPESK